jgi:hypothetical protein
MYRTPYPKMKDCFFAPMRTILSCLCGPRNDSNACTTGEHPTRFIVPAQIFTSAFPKIGYLAIRRIIVSNKVNYSKRTIIQASDLKAKLDFETIFEIDHRWSKTSGTIVSGVTIILLLRRRASKERTFVVVHDNYVACKVFTEPRPRALSRSISLKFQLNFGEIAPKIATFTISPTKNVAKLISPTKKVAKLVSPTTKLFLKPAQNLVG